MAYNKVYQAAYYAANREKIIAYQADYAVAHPEKIAARSATYGAAHREERAAYRATYYADATHREEKAKCDAAYYAANREERATYVAWYSMVYRCKKSKKYSGVKVCRRWLTYSNFLADMGKRPSPQHSLSRLADVPLYSPKTVVWGTRSHQELQKRTKRERMKAAA